MAASTTGNIVAVSAEEDSILELDENETLSPAPKRKRHCDQDQVEHWTLDPSEATINKLRTWMDKARNDEREPVSPYQKFRCRYDINDRPIREVWPDSRMTEEEERIMRAQPHRSRSLKKRDGLERRLLGLLHNQAIFGAVLMGQLEEGTLVAEVASLAMENIAEAIANLEKQKRQKFGAVPPPPPPPPSERRTVTFTGGIKQKQK